MTWLSCLICPAQHSDRPSEGIRSPAAVAAAINVQSSGKGSCGSMSPWQCCKAACCRLATSRTKRGGALSGWQGRPHAPSRAVRLRRSESAAGKHARAEAAIGVQQDVKEQLRQEGALRLAQSSAPQDSSAGEQDEEMVPVVQDDTPPTDLSHFGRAFKVLSWHPQAVPASR